ncbi:FYVE zinc finger containing protein [Novymonas esmeraldas]|uniref:FYVE zinc finger containing protein n=1 Tax=Novymonas esmeraldas TaxID=1808958 RepID=A0AAW0F1E7_9TRYP
MGKSSDSAAPGQRCAQCERGFGMMLWKHTCDVCRRTVCDDCAPRSTDSVDADGGATKLRVCKSCSVTGHRLGGSAADTTLSPAAARPDLNSEAERERRARLVEERNKAQQSRGRQLQANGGSAPRPGNAAARPTPPVAAATSPPPAQPNTQVLSSTDSPSPTAASAARPANPALEAALRRQQQQQQQAGARNAGSAAAAASPEKLRLLQEIEAVLAKHGEDPPFGLRASDEAKLRGYLQFIKSKHHVSD